MNVFKKNLSWLLIGNILHAGLQFILNIFSARVFGDADFGLMNYAASLIAFFTSIGTLGFNGIITKKLAINEKSANEYLGTAVISRVVFSVIAIIVLQIIIRTGSPDEPLLYSIVFYQSLSILFNSLDTLMYWFRYKNEAKYVAIIRLAGFFVSAIVKAYSMFVVKSIELFVVGITVENLCFMLMLSVLYKHRYGLKNFKFSKEIFFEMLRISYPFISSAVLITVYAETDKIMLKHMLDNQSVGFYSVALSLTSVISIIPTALIEGFRPDVMTFKLKNERDYRTRLQQLYGIVFWLCTAYSLFMTIFGRYVIMLLYGESYMPAVSVLSLIVWYTSFSYFGSINNMFMVAEGCEKWVQITTLTGSVTNILLNFLLIPSMGIAGAALASLATQFIANFVLLIIIKPLRKTLRIMIDGVTLKWLFAKFKEKI